MLVGWTSAVLLQLLRGDNALGFVGTPVPRIAAVHAATVASLVHQAVLEMQMLRVDAGSISAEVAGLDLGSRIVLHVLKRLRVCTGHDSVTKILDVLVLDLDVSAAVDFELGGPAV